MSRQLFAFTPEGVAEYQAVWYVLPEEDLLREAAAAGAGLAAWLPTRFALSEGQRTFLDQLPKDIVAHWSSSVAYFLAHRLPIVLVKPSEPPTPKQQSVKLVTSDDNTASEATQTRREGGNVLTFTITYEGTVAR